MAMSLTQPVSPMAATLGDQAIERPDDPDTATMQGGAAHAVATQARPALARTAQAPSKHTGGVFQA